MMRDKRWILPFTCLRRWCVAKLSLDRQPQHFYYYLYSVKIMWSAERRKDKCIKIEQRGSQDGFSGGLAMPLGAAHSPFLSDDRSSNKNVMDQADIGHATRIWRLWVF